MRWPSGRPRCGSQSSFAAARREPLAGGGYARLGLVEPALTFALFDFGIDRTGAAEAAVQSIFAVALSWLLLRRASSATFWLVLASSAAAALAAVNARRIGTTAGEADAVMVTAWQLLAAAIACAPVLAVAALAGRSMLGAADPAHLLAAVATGLLGSAVPFLLYNTAIRDLNVSVAAVILNLIPVFGAALAVALLGNSLSPLQLVGAAAIVLAALGIDRSADHDDGPRSGEYAAPGLTDADAPRPTACAHAATVALLADRAG